MSWLTQLPVRAVVSIASEFKSPSAAAARNGNANKAIAARILAAVFLAKLADFLDIVRTMMLTAGMSIRKRLQRYKKSRL